MSDANGHYAFEDWADLALGGLPLETDRAMESHRRACGDCDALAREARALATSARVADAAPPESSIWPELAARLPERRGGWLGWLGHRPGWVMVAGAVAAAWVAMTLATRLAAPVSAPQPVAVTGSLDLADWPGVWLLRPESGIVATVDELPPESEASIGTADDPDYDALTPEELAMMKQYLADWQSASL